MLFDNKTKLQEIDIIRDLDMLDQIQRQREIVHRKLMLRGGTGKDDVKTILKAQRDFDKEAKRVKEAIVRWKEASIHFISDGPLLPFEFSQED